MAQVPCKRSNWQVGYPRAEREDGFASSTLQVRSRPVTSFYAYTWSMT